MARQTARLTGYFCADHYKNSILANDQFNSLAFLLWCDIDIALGRTKLPMTRQFHDHFNAH